MFMRDDKFEFDKAFRGNTMCASPQETEGSLWTEAARVAVAGVAAGVVGFAAGAVVDSLFGTDTKALVGTSAMLMELFFGADDKPTSTFAGGTTKAARSSLSPKGLAVKRGR